MAAKRGKGRPEKDKDEPPMPAKWKETERLAVCLAYLEASERNKTSAQALEAEISKNYATQLDYVHKEVAEFEPSSHKWKNHGNYIFTIEESKKRRVNQDLCNVFLGTRKFCVNIIQPIYLKLHNSDGQPPSGTGQPDLLRKMHAELEGLGSDNDLDGDSPPPAARGGGGLADGGGEPDPDLGEESEAQATQARPKKKSKNTNYLQHFLTWEHLGPFGKNHVQFLS